MKQEALSLRRKEQMAAALKELMVQKSLQKITIQEIADNCGMNRYTFYYHFQDIYDLVSWTFRQEALSLIQKSGDCRTWEDGIRLFLRYIQENAQVCRCALDSLGQDALRQMFHQETSELMRSYLTDIKGPRKISEAYMDFLTDFYVEALSGTVLRWQQQGMETPEDTLIRYLHLTLEGHFPTLFDRAEQASL